MIIRQIDHDHILFDFSNRKNRLLNFVLRSIMFLLSAITIIVVITLTVMGAYAFSILAFCGIVGIFVALAFAFKEHLLKEVHLSPLGIQFLYYIPMHNYRVPKGFQTFNFIVNSTDDKLELELFNQKIGFNNPKEFTTFLETFTDLFDLEFEESIMIEDGKERLIYKR